MWAKKVRNMEREEGCRSRRVFPGSTCRSGLSALQLSQDILLEQTGMVEKAGKIGTSDIFTLSRALV